jgi:hypothetical protein
MDGYAARVGEGVVETPLYIGDQLVEQASSRNFIWSVISPRLFVAAVLDRQPDPVDVERGLPMRVGGVVLPNLRDRAAELKDNGERSR